MKTQQQADLFKGEPPQMETIFHAIRAQHAQSQAAQIFAPDATTLMRDLQAIFPECHIRLKHVGTHRYSAVVGLPSDDPRKVLPEDLRALSLTQPWGWMVSGGWKDIENRTPGFSYKSFRGPFLIHGAQTCTRGDFVSTVSTVRQIDSVVGIRIPPYDLLERGGIVGIARIVDIIPPGESGRKWHFQEQYGFVVKDARPLPFIPCKGLQGFWRVPADVRAQVEKAMVAA